MTYILYIRFGTNHSGLTVDIITCVDMSCTLYYVLAEPSDIITKKAAMFTHVILKIWTV